MDPLSITASSIAVSQLAVVLTKGMRKLVQLRHVPEQVLQLNNELAEINSVFAKVDHLITRSCLGNPDDEKLLHSLLDRLKDPMSQLENLIKLLSIDHDDEKTNVEFSKRAWLKHGSKAQRLLISLRELRVNVNDALLIISATENVHFRTELRAVAVAAARTEKSRLHEQSKSQRGLAAINDTLLTFAPLMQHIQQTLDDDMEARQHNGRVIRRNDTCSGPGSLSTQYQQPIEFRTTVQAPKACAAACPCSCHRMAVLQYPAWAKKLVGQLFVGYSGIPLLNSNACSERSCKSGRRVLVKVSYFFPRWLVSRMIFFMSDSNSYDHGSPMIRIPKVVSSDSEIFILAQKGNIPGMQRYFSEGKGSIFDVNDTEGRSPIHLAISARQPEACAFLMSLGADSRVEDRFSISPIDLLWNYLLQNDRRGDKSAMQSPFEALLDDGDDLVKRRLTPLHRIIFGLSEIDLDSYLRLTTAEIDVQCSHGRTPLFWAAIRHNPDHLKTLLAYNASVEIADSRKQTPIHVAAAYGLLESLEVLLEAATKPYGTSHASTNPKLARWVNGLDIKGRTPLHGAIHGRQPQHAEMLLKYGADVDVPDSVLEQTALMLCIYWGHSHLIWILLQHGASLTLRDRHGMNALHYAAQYGSEDTIDALTQNIPPNTDLDPDGVDNRDKTALELFTYLRPLTLKEEIDTRIEAGIAFHRLLRVVQSRFRPLDSETCILDIGDEDEFFDCPLGPVSEIAHNSPPV
ncbi:ankyrin repeat-containing domain protein [Truncatella angustata]|uniref:Ankyrin repeat-containing domain protein n=1 Tax=Truncatella angustata TaxID=152316 RepID=A0A9P8UHN6_9PEZI|nr:ankyrin repeat-containing domain protein [Truncatella angustata]KAH6652404.1 ankyrin repeat-containing domain protein [Truncatella angustata]